MASHLVSFEKYCSTGNDFIVFDVSQEDLSNVSGPVWERLCHRQMGIGADGVLLIKKLNSNPAFAMTYLNADGNEVAMCGNGARAAVDFAIKKFDLDASKEIQFKTLNGIYRARFQNNEVMLQMTELYDEGNVEIKDLYFSSHQFYVNTGVPHCVYKVSDVAKVDLMKIAPSIRYDQRFSEGTNVNFYQVLSQHKLRMRTYERGVEGETLSCGTGAVATAIAEFRESSKTGTYEIETPGGLLKVSLNADLSEVYLAGSVIKTFEGQVELSKFE